LSKYTKILQAWRDYLILATAAFVSFALIFLGNDSEKTSGVHAIAIEMLGRLASPLGSARQLLDIRSENERLQRLNFQLQLQNSRYAEAYQENLRLRQLIGFPPSAEFDGLPARVIGRGGTVGLSTIIFDLGSEKGIRPDMPILSAEGLVGKVISVAPHHATGQILLDRNFRVAARVQRSRVQGIFRCVDMTVGRLEEVGRRSDVQAGDVIVTSGMSYLFPPGLRIGVVMQAQDSDAGLFKEINIKPYVDFDKLEEIFVLRYKPPEN
jgi:rod shape-determining protein MreC